MLKGILAWFRSIWGEVLGEEYEERGVRPGVAIGVVDLVSRVKRIELEAEMKNRRDLFASAGAFRPQTVRRDKRGRFVKKGKRAA